MNKPVYIKPPLSVQEQIDLLKTRGLQIPDEDKASRYLQNIGYFHLSGYMYPFLSDKKRHQYKLDSCFDDIINLYRFDRELRVLIFSTIEKIEVAIRAQIANHFAINEKDAFWYTDAKYFSSASDHQTFLNNTLTYIKRSTDVFIIHFFDTYSNIFPPVWVVLEALSMGQLSILYNITKRSPSRKAIANYFGIKEPVLANWLHALVYVRNICAHHARLWNKDLRIQIKYPKTINRIWLSSGDITKRKIYEVLAIIACFLDTITPTNTFRSKLNDLLVKYPDIDITAMGFPKDWKDDPFWNGMSKPITSQSIDKACL